jgi:RNA 2',3'-cyclic 3'-phosphodiesterase
MPTLRLFTALELPPALRRQLADLISAFSASLPRGSVRWVRAEGVHLTLKFYGEVSQDKVPGLQASLRQAAQGASPLQLELEGLGTFPNAVRPRVIWVGLKGDLERLGALQRMVEEGAAPLGFAPEARGFSPHLTLGRVNAEWRPADKQKLGEAFARLGPGLHGRFTAETLSLMRSDLRPSGAVYTCLLAAALGGPAG